MLRQLEVWEKGYLPISLITPIKLKEILEALKTTVQKSNSDFDLVIKRLYLYIMIRK